MERFLAFLALVIAGAIVSQPRAQSLEHGPVVLVASPKLAAGWAQTVLLAAPAPNGMHVGLVINRPTEKHLTSLFPDHEPSRKVADPVFFGGPFQPGMLVALVRGKPTTSTGILPLDENLYLALQGEVIDRVIETHPDSARFYVGFILWRPGELEQEIKEGYWSMRHASESTLFSNEARGLWKKLQVRGISVSLPAAAR